MDKIVYVCNPVHLGYEFPKRKWWDFRKKERDKEMELTGLFPGENIDVRLRIVENYPVDYEIFIEKHWEKEIWKMFLETVLEKCDSKRGDFAKDVLAKGVCEKGDFAKDVLAKGVCENDDLKNDAFKKKASEKNPFFSAMFVVDVTGDDFSGFLTEFVEDKNYLAVFTMHPEKYDGVMDEIAMECGLVGMVCTDYSDYVRYRRQIGEQNRTIILWGNGEKTKSRNGRPVCYRFGKDDFVIDFTAEREYEKMFLKKRMEPACVSLSVFLDNIVKNGYNSVVNEGLYRL